MKVTTINGETLRKEFTAIEAAALKHAAEYCVEGDQFTGVPTSNEERYRLSKETFGVIEHDGNFVGIIRHSTGKTLRAMINGGNGGGTKPQPKGGKVKIYDWVSKDYLKPLLCGVFHDAENKVAVATDTHAVIVSKRDYIECEESHIVDKNGDDIRARYVDYKCIMLDTDECLLYDVDREKVKRILTEYRAERKLDKSVEYLAINIGSPDSLRKRGW